jgi:hypothetical protein
MIETTEEPNQFQPFREQAEVEQWRIIVICGRMKKDELIEPKRNNACTHPCIRMNMRAWA